MTNDIYLNILIWLERCFEMQNSLLFVELSFYNGNFLVKERVFTQQAVTKPSLQQQL